MFNQVLMSLVTDAFSSSADRERCIVFNATSHASALLTSMCQLRNEHNLCDITLRSGEQEFDAHKIVLAASSPYFNAMFTNEHVESRLEKVTLNGVDPIALSQLIDFAYSATLTICEDTVQMLLSAANQLQITAVVEACCDFLRDRIDPENCLGIAAFADMHGCSQLFVTSWKYAIENFRQLSKTEEFLTTPAPLLAELVKSEDLRVRSEEELLECVLRWYRHDEPSRIKVVPSILQHVKLPLIPYDILSTKLLANQSLAGNPECQLLITSAESFQSDSRVAEKWLNTTEYIRYVPRKSIGQCLFVYVVGGETSPGRLTVSTLEGYNPSKNTWRVLAPMAKTRRGVGIAVLYSMLYAVGGSDGVQALRLVERYDPHSNTWSPTTDMKQERSSVAVSVLGGYLYAIGGYDGIMSCLSTVERFDPSTDEWSFVAEMNIPRSMHATGVIADRIYVVGGYDGSTDLSSCEVYDPKSDSWNVIKEMHSKRCMAAAGVIDDLLYVVGGCYCSQSLSSMEVYDPNSNQWTVKSDMLEARSGLGVGVVGSKLFALGGNGADAGYSSSVECYDPVSDSWTPVASMSTGRRRFGCCS